MKILIVDDDTKRADKINDLIKSSCEECKNYSIKIIYNYSDAKNLIKKDYFDILILDVILPMRNNDTPSSKIGLKLLGEITRRQGFQLPERIIGITANKEDIGSYQKKFQESCFAVIEANPNNLLWQDQLINAIDYTKNSNIIRKNRYQSIVITVHGIRTYGKWQNRFQNLAKNEYKDIEFNSYKYGYFTILSFFIPWIRNKEVAKFKERLDFIINENPDKVIKIFSHSFGTYISTLSVTSLVQSKRNLPIELLVLSGSVLKADHDWSSITGLTNIKVINDCGISDYVLWLSEALIPNTGMAGREGFNGLNNSQFINRFHIGGHSHYFDEDNFLKEFWLPLLSSSNFDKINQIDEREPAVLIEVAQRMIKLIGKIKIYIYALGLFLLLHFYLG